MICPKCNTSLTLLTPATTMSLGYKIYFCGQCAYERNVFPATSAGSNDIVVNHEPARKIGASD